ncbi:MAG: hypothetical protein QME81_19380, partial [bacterium]|nr:hypothetical protein [bacterium]
MFTQSLMRGCKEILLTAENITSVKEAPLTNMKGVRYKKSPIVEALYYYPATFALCARIMNIKV